MGASAAMASLAACSMPQPEEKIVPTVDNPEGQVPGVPRFYASTLPMSGWLSGHGRGVIVESHEGRPTKIEGNPDHPSSLGGTDIFMQAAVLQLYDPDRSRNPQRANNPANFSQVIEDVSAFINSRGGPGKVRVRLLTRRITSPTLAAQIAAFKRTFPNAQWHTHDPLADLNTRAGLRRALGQDATIVYDFTKARRIFALDSHFLAELPGSVRYAREFSMLRRPAFQPFGPNVTHCAEKPPAFSAEAMSRLYVAESSLTGTGAMADHRLPIQSRLLPALSEEIARLILGQSSLNVLPQPAATFAAAVAADLKSVGRDALLIVGEYQPPEVQALAWALNATLQSAAVRYIEPIEARPDAEEALGLDDVDLLLILDTNPAFTAPADVNFAEALRAFAADSNHLVLHIGPYMDETAALCRLHVPLGHPLEAWGDLRAHDGTASIVQPLIRPLWASKSAIEVLAALTTGGEGYDLVRAHWRDVPWKESLR
jgi:molybdopterin-containing oxidoreductase family iron-sulfur binding subunit